MAYIPALLQSGTTLFETNNLSVSGQLSAPYLTLPNQSSDVAAVTNAGVLYSKTDGKLYFRTPTGIETVVGPDGSQADAINVKNSPYFAKGDQVTDDTTAINQAILDGNATKRPVFIPPGIYKITPDVIHIPQTGVEVFGVYKQTVLSGQNGFTLMTGPANQSLVMSGTYIHDIWFTTADDVNATSAGLFFSKSDGLVVQRCTFNNQHFYGFSINDVCTRMMLIENEAFHIHQDVTATGLNPRYAQDSIIARNYVHDINQDTNDSRSHAIYVPGTYSDLVFSQNIIDNCTSGPSLGTNSGPVCQNIIITENIITNIKRIQALSVNNARNVVMTDNTIRTGGLGSNGIQLGPLVIGFNCSNNTINLDGSDATGISIADPGPTSDPSELSYLGVVSNNTIIKTDAVGRGAGIEIDSDGQNFIITGNIITNLDRGIYVVSRQRVGTIDTVRKTIIDNNHLTIDRSLPNTHLDRCFTVSINGGAQNVIITNNSASNCDSVVEIDSDGNSGFGQPNNILIKGNYMWGQGLYGNNIGQDEARANAYNLTIVDNFLDSGNNLWNTPGLTTGGAEGRNVYQANNRLFSTPWTPKDAFYTANRVDMSQVDMIGFAAGTLAGIDYGHLGQTVKILSSGLLTVNNGTSATSTFLLNGGVNVTLQSGESLSLTQFTPGVWRETARSRNNLTTQGNLTVAGNSNISGSAVAASFLGGSVSGTSITSSGILTASGQLLLKDGSLASPGWAFNNETNTGWLRNGAGDIQLSKLGIRYMELTNTDDIMLGNTALATNAGIALGYQANATSAGEAIAIGYQSAATGFVGIAHGFRAKSFGSGALAIGLSAIASGNNDTVIGSNASTGLGGTGGGTAVGVGATAIGSSATALGQNATTSGIHAIAIGFDAGIGPTGFGAGTAGDSIAIGTNTVAAGGNAVAIGNLASTSTFTSAVAIGSNSSVQGANSVAIGPNIVAPPASSSAIGSNITMSSAAGGSVVMGNAINITGSNTVLIGPSARSFAADGAVGIGQLCVVSGQNSIVIGRQAAENTTSSTNVLIGPSSTINGNVSNSVGLGPQVVVNALQAIAIGFLTTISGTSSIAIGRQANVGGNNSIALGVTANTNLFTASVALGNAAVATQNNQIALGTATEQVAVRGTLVVAGTTTFSGIATGIFTSSQYNVSGGAANTFIATTGTDLAFATNNVVAFKVNSNQVVIIGNGNGGGLARSSVTGGVAFVNNSSPANNNSVPNGTPDFSISIDTVSGTSSVPNTRSHYLVSSTTGAFTKNLPTPVNSFAGQIVYFVQEGAHVMTVGVPSGVTVTMQTGAAVLTTKTGTNFVSSGNAGDDGTSAMLVCTATDSSTVATWRQLGGVGTWT